MSTGADGTGPASTRERLRFIGDRRVAGNGLDRTREVSRSGAACAGCKIRGITLHRWGTASPCSAKSLGYAAYRNKKRRDNGKWLPGGMIVHPANPGSTRAPVPPAFLIGAVSFRSQDRTVPSVEGTQWPLSDTSRRSDCRAVASRHGGLRGTPGCRAAGDSSAAFPPTPQSSGWPMARPPRRQAAARFRTGLESARAQGGANACATLQRERREGDARPGRHFRRPEGASYRSAGGRLQIDGASEHYETSAETLSVAAQALSAAAGGRPVVLLARPGMHGSSGDHARDRHTRMRSS